MQPIVKGGQGRSDESVVSAAENLVVIAIIAMLAIIAALMNI